MIYPIVAYGDPVLKKEAKEIALKEDIKELISDMFDTMYQAKGVGLAAPQIGKSIRIFIVDGTPLLEDEGITFKKVFINPTIKEEFGDDWAYEEGCLSIPGITENVTRAEGITLHYYDEDWNEHEEEFEGIQARIIQHEYDHIDGILFTDHLGALKRKMIKKKLVNISKGNIPVRYRMKFPSK